MAAEFVVTGLAFDESVGGTRTHVVTSAFMLILRQIVWTAARVGRAWTNVPIVLLESPRVSALMC